MKNKKVLIIAVGIIVLACIIGAVIFATGAGSRKLNKQLNLGNKFLTELNYEQALASFKKAISIDPKNVEAYLGAADAYIKLADAEKDFKDKRELYDEAVDLLKDGYDITSDNRLQSKIDEINELIIFTEAVDSTFEEGSSQQSEPVAIEETTVAEEREEEIPQVEFVNYTIIEAPEIPYDGDWSFFENGYQVHTWTGDAPTNTTYIYDLEGNLINTLQFSYDQVSSGYGVFYYGLKGSLYMVVAGIEDYAERDVYTVVDSNGEVVWSMEDNGYGECSLGGLFVYNDDLIIICEDYDRLIYYNIDEGHEIEEPDVKLTSRYAGDAPEKWSSAYKYNEYVDYYFVGNSTNWGFLDESGNEVAMYMDASNFNTDGYTLVSYDRVTYVIVDRDFNVVSDAIPAVSASYASDTNWFRMRRADDSVFFIKIN